MNYAVIATVNGNFIIHSEHGTDLNAAKAEFHGYARTLTLADDVVKAEIKLVDDQLDCVKGYAEFINHDVVE